MNGWVSTTLPQLISETTPLHTGPLTNDEVSWIGSINALAAFVGTVVAGVLIVLLGSKRTMLFFAVPCVLFWTLIYIGDSYSYVLFARFVTGKDPYHV